MKLYDVYLNKKAKYYNYVVMIESGIFYETFDKDSVIINKLVGYKILNNSNKLRLGFPSGVLNKVILELKVNHINYLVISKNGEILKKKYKDNNYDSYISDFNYYINIDNRIDLIYNKLKLKMKDDNIDNILSGIEKVL